MGLVAMKAPQLVLPRLHLPGDSGEGIVRDGLVACFKFDERQGQRLIDWSPYGNHGTLGSSIGADTNDPAWTPQGLSFITDDYITTLLSITGDWSLQIVCSYNDDTGLYYSIGLVATATKGVFRNNVLKSIGIYDGTSVLYTNTTVNTGTYNLSTITRQGNNFSISNNIENPAKGVLVGFNISNLELGRRYNGYGYLSGVEVYFLAYNRVLTVAERNINYYALKAELAPRGVILS